MALPLAEKDKRVFGIAAAVALFYSLSVALVYRHIGYSVLVGDPAGYAHWSHDLVHNVVYYHLPAYPAAIAALRFLVLGLLGDAPLMQLLCFVFWCGGLYYVCRLLREYVPEGWEIGLLIYALFPLHGMSSIADVAVDSMSYFCVTGGLWYATKEKWGRVAAMIALGLLVNKGIWPFLLLLTLVCGVKTRRSWPYLVAAYLPVAIYYAVLAIHYNDWFWIVRPHVHIHLESRSKLWLMDGVLGTLGKGGFVGVGKGILLLSVALAGAVLTVWVWMQRQWLLLVACVPVIVYALLLNQPEALSIFRFSKLLVIPLMMWLARRPSSMRILKHRLVLAFLILILLGSQAAWNAYSVHWHHVHYPDASAVAAHLNCPGVAQLSCVTHGR
jgi:hypothetical protein